MFVRSLPSGARGREAKRLLICRKHRGRIGAVAGAGFAAVALSGLLWLAFPTGYRPIAAGIIPFALFWYRAGASWWEKSPHIVLLIRKFHGQRTDFVLAKCLGDACRHLAAPPTVQDSSFRGTLPVLSAVMQRIFWLVLVFTTVLLIRNEIENSGGRVLLILLTAASTGTLFWLMLRRASVYRLGAGNYQRKLLRILRRMRNGRGAYSGTRVVKMPDECWRDAVWMCIREADAVVIDISVMTDNIEWEIRSAFGTVAPESILLCWRGNADDLLASALSRAALRRIVPGSVLARCPTQSYPSDTGLDNVVCEALAVNIALCLAGNRNCNIETVPSLTEWDESERQVWPQFLRELSDARLEQTTKDYDWLADTSGARHFVWVRKQCQAERHRRTAASNKL